MPSTAAQLAHAEQVERLARCRRCGATDVAWVTSRRTGRPYMVHAEMDTDGIIWAERRTFHQCKPEDIARVDAEAVAGNTITHTSYTPVVTEGFYTIVEPEGTHLTLRGSCARCGRTLTVPVSIHRGFGPDCARMLGIV